MTAPIKESQQNAGVTKKTTKGPQAKSDGASQSKSGTSDSVNEARRQVNDATKQAKDELKDAGKVVGAEASKAANSAKEKGKQFVNKQKGRIADELGACSDSLREAAEKYDSESEANLGQYANAAADMIGRAKSYLEDRELPDLLHDAEDAIRKNREMAYGACFIAGLGLARFLKATASNGSRQIPESSSASATPSVNQPTRTGVNPAEAANSPRSLEQGHSPHFSASPSGTSAKKS